MTPNAMHPHGSDAATTSQVERNTLQIDWFSALYGIFWNVWLGLFVLKTTTECKVPSISDSVNVNAWLQINLPWVVMVLLVTTVTAHTLALTKWLISMRVISSDVKAGIAFAAQWTAIGLTGATIVALFAFATLCSIDPKLVVFGILIVSSWVGIVLIMVLGHSTTR